MQPVSATVTTDVSSSALIAPFTFPATINCPLSSISPLNVTPRPLMWLHCLFSFFFSTYSKLSPLLGNSYSSSGREFYLKLAQFVESLESNKSFKKKLKVPELTESFSRPIPTDPPKASIPQNFLFFKVFSNLS